MAVNIAVRDDPYTPEDAGSGGTMASENRDWGYRRIQSATAPTAAAVPRNALRDSINDATISERFQEVAAPAGSRHKHLDHRDLAPRGLVADRIHHVRGLQHQQP